MNIPADRKPRSQNARFQKKYCFRYSETHSLIGKIWPNLGAQILPNLRFVWVFGKMCKTLFHPLLEQAFQRRDRRSLLFELNELGMKFLTADHAASMVPVWQLIFSFRR